MRKGGDTIAVKAAGLPNVQLYIGKTEYYTANPPQTIILEQDKSPGYTFREMEWAADTLAYQSISLHLGNPIYGASTTVQPPAITLLPQIKY